MKVVGVALTFSVASVLGGFCDSSVGSGYRCDGQTSKYCKCKTKSGKKKCSKTSETFCPNQGTGYRCKYGGRCSPPPPPPAADEICASSSLSTLTPASHKAATAFCPVVKFPYKTWKNFYDTGATLDASLIGANADVLWFEDLRLQMAQPLDDDVTIENMTALAENYPTVANTWTATCAANVLEYSCRAHIPECKFNKGVLSQCETVCAKIDACAESFFSACKTYSAANPNTVNCSSYEMLYPEYVVKEEGPFKGKRNCPLFCAQNQNDYIASGAVDVLPPLALVTGLLALVM